MKKCPFCAEDVAATAASCPHCERSFAIRPLFAENVSARPPRSAISKLFWVISLLASAAGVLTGLGGVAAAAGAPQEAAAAAIACLVVIGPYAFARASTR